MKKQHKEGTCKVLGRSVIFQHFMQIFVFAPNQLLSPSQLKRVLLFQVLLQNRYLY